MSATGTAFQRALREREVDPEGRRWVYVPYDQLTDEVGPLSGPPSELGVVMVENPWKAARRPYHKQKLALVLANGRQFALEQARRGVAVRHVVTDGPYHVALTELAAELGPLQLMEPAERELRADLARCASGVLEVVPHEGWLTTAEDFDPKGKGPPWRMEPFYRRARQRTGLLMTEDGAPEGDRFNFDRENRRPWRGDPPAPTPPRFEADEVTAEVLELVATCFAHHPGQLAPDELPATREDARALWRWALTDCMPHFGPYEDAMSVDSDGLFHTRVSALLHLCRLLPRALVEDVAALDVGLASREGFVRQILGWREFVRHVHRATDGFRALPEVTARPAPGDGGHAAWSGEPWDGSTADDLDGGAEPTVPDASPVPPAFWGARSGLACLDRVVADVWRTGYGHHITRLMVLANIGTLLDVDPRGLTDWFWCAYTDAYDWVVEPNVLGMGTFAIGDAMTTKPYVSGAAYINRMSDYCADCPFDPRKSCPITRLYWAYLDRHRERLAGNHRMNLPLGSLRKRSSAERARDAETFERVRAALLAGEPVD